MKLLVIEQPLKNRGDESAHRGLIRKLSETYPMAEIQVLFYGMPQKDIDDFVVGADNVEYINVPMSLLYHKYFNRFVKLFTMLSLHPFVYLLPKMRQILKYFEQADYVICAPGGIDMGGFQNWTHIAFLDISRRMNKKNIYFGRSIGPFTDSGYFSARFGKMSCRLLKSFSYVSLRDGKSQDIAHKLGVDCVNTIDSAFLVRPSVVIPQSVREHIGDAGYISFVPNSLAWHFAFKSYSFCDIKAFWVSLLNRLVEEYPDEKVVMLPQTTGWTEYLPDGYRFFMEIRGACQKPEQVYVLDEQYGSDIQQNIISHTKLLIGARYHSIIFSLNQSVPFISLSYEHKMNGVLQILGKEDCQINLPDYFNGDSIGNFSEELIDRIISLTHSVKADRDASQRASLIANSGFDKLKEVLR